MNLRRHSRLVAFSDPRQRALMRQPLLYLLATVGVVLAPWTVAGRPLSLGSQTLAVGAPGCLETFHGLWRGPGVVLGRAIVMQQRWAPAMGGAFTELRMEHLSTDSSARVLFEGRGLYRASSAPASDSVSGSWFDARGVTLAVSGTCVDGVLSSWWSGSERGRTIYRRRGDELLVVDSAFPPAGLGREFGRSLLHIGR